MLKFDKRHKVDINKLDIDEADAYTEFLGDERARHLRHAETCTYMAERHRTLLSLWKSEAFRQIEEVRKIDERKKKVKERFDGGIK